MQFFVYVLRHGKPEGENRLRGHTDFAITAEGLAQMHDSAKQINQVDYVITSPLRRCSDFAQEIASQRSVECEANHAWKEMHFGDWDGLKPEHLWNDDIDGFRHFSESPWQANVPNGEAVEAFDKRVSNAWLDLLNQHKGKNLLLVTHGGVMKQLTRQLLDMPKNADYLRRLQFPYAALLTISVYMENNQFWPSLVWPNQGELC